MHYRSLAPWPLFRARVNASRPRDGSGTGPRKNRGPSRAVRRLADKIERHRFSRESEPYRPRPNRPGCLLPWRTLGKLQRRILPSGFSLRNKSVKSCSKALGAAVPVRTRRSLRPWRAVGLAVGFARFAPYSFRFALRWSFVCGCWPRCYARLRNGPISHVLRKATGKEVYEYG